MSRLMQLAGTLPRATMIFALAIGFKARASVFTYECLSLPQDAGWTIVQIYCAPPQWVDSGWFWQAVDLCPGDPPPPVVKVRCFDDPYQNSMDHRSFMSHLDWRRMLIEAGSLGAAGRISLLAALAQRTIVFRSPAIRQS